MIGHECFGIVEEAGPNVRRVKVGDYVTCTVRRPGGSIYDRIGRSDITSEEQYYERGINLRHGYLTEYFVDDEEFVVRIPVGLRDLALGEATWLGVIQKILTTPVQGLDNYREMMRLLVEDKHALKAYVNVAEG